MAIVTTYVCDVTGKSGTSNYDFVNVEIVATEQKLKNGYCHTLKVTAKKLVHKDVAAKLNLIKIEDGVVEQPEVSFEGKLKALLEDHVQYLVEGHLENFSRN